MSCWHTCICKPPVSALCHLSPGWKHSPDFPVKEIHLSGISSLSTHYPHKQAIPNCHSRNLRHNSTFIWLCSSQPRPHSLFPQPCRYQLTTLHFLPSSSSTAGSFFVVGLGDGLTPGLGAENGLGPLRTGPLWAFRAGFLWVFMSSETCFRAVRTTAALYLSSAQGFGLRQ